MWNENITQEQYNDIMYALHANHYEDVFRKVQNGTWTEEMFVEYMTMFSISCAEEARYGGRS